MFILIPFFFILFALFGGFIIGMFGAPLLVSEGLFFIADLADGTIKFSHRQEST